MSKKFDVYGVGNAIMDLQLNVSDDDLRQHSLEKGAMKLMEADEQQRLLQYFSSHNPVQSSAVQSSAVQSSGGSAANTVIAISQLGGKAAFSGLVADDEYGRFYWEEMDSLGVVLNNRPQKSVAKSGAPGTGTCVVLITPDAERTMNTHLGVSATLAPMHLSASHIADAQWLYIEGYLFSQPSGREAVERAIAIAKKAGVKVAVTFSDGFIVDFFREPLDSAVSKADLIFCNLNEGRRFTGETEEEKVFEKLKQTVPNVAFTLSERGAWIHFGKSEFKLPAFSVKAVDDTGAGDMFAGAFLYGITNGQTAEASAKMACLLASKVVSQLGARLKVDVRELVAQLG